MKPRSSPNIGISEVERETGLSMDVLRKWEGRYGFPAPLRDGRRTRRYPPQQVERLRLIKRLMDTGMRPSQLVGQDEDALAAFARKAPDARHEACAIFLVRLRNDGPEGLRQQLLREHMSLGTERFVLDIIVPLNTAVGDAWARGELDLHEEHAYSEVIQCVLRNMANQLNGAGYAPRVLLTTLPGEEHGLGILMAAALFSLHEAYCISLGTQTPVQAIALAARAHDVDVVALSFSSAYPRRRIGPALDALRRELGAGVESWAGGAGAARMRAGTSGTLPLATLEQGLEALRRRPATRASGMPASVASSP